ncbi:hypothetical protein, partial [Nocardia sp. NRRL S-836]|uniref:hypothetical protein n=1 Tax=Nocardia sp. NRRL S-836 TaxID=1519492 RepID=UPI0006C4B683
NTLWLVAFVAVWAAASEVLGYVLLGVSRFGALSPALVNTSYAMAVSSAALLVVGWPLALLFTVLWARRARHVDATIVG